MRAGDLGSLDSLPARKVWGPSARSLRLDYVASDDDEKTPEDTNFRLDDFVIAIAGPPEILRRLAGTLRKKRSAVPVVSAPEGLTERAVLHDGDIHIVEGDALLHHPAVIKKHGWSLHHVLPGKPLEAGDRSPRRG